jgi:hypothetical protein
MNSTREYRVKIPAATITVAETNRNMAAGIVAKHLRKFGFVVQGSLEVEQLNTAARFAAKQLKAA